MISEVALRSSLQRLCYGGSMLPAPFVILPRSLCSLPLRFHFSVLASFYQFSLLLFHLSLLPAPFFNFSSASLLPFLNFCAPCSQITFSFLPAPFHILGLAPCSLESKAILPAPWLPLTGVHYIRNSLRSAISEIISYVISYVIMYKITYEITYVCNHLCSNLWHGTSGTISYIITSEVPFQRWLRTEFHT